MKRVIWIVLTAGLVCGAARADEEDAWLRSGRAAEARGDLGAARASYAEAHARAPRFETAAALGLCEAATGAEGAAEHLTEALASFPDDGSAALRERLERELASVAGPLAEVTVEAPDGARISVGGRFVGTAPLTRPLYLTPGEQRLVAEKDGARAVVKRELPRGPSQVRLVPTEPEVLPVVLVATGSALSLVALALGAGLLAAGESEVDGAAATRAALDARGLADPCGQQPGWCRQIDEGAVAGDDLRLAGAILLASGGAILGGTIAYAIAASAGGDDAPVAPLVGDGVYGASLRLRF